VIEHWRQLHWTMAEKEALAYSGIRKIVGDLQFEIPGEDFHTDLTFEDLGYSATAKFNQLKRNYWNQESVDKALEKLLSRKGSNHASASIRMQAGDKDSRSSGFCMQNMTITVCRERGYVDMHYRSTEVSMKFLADLVFLARMLPPLLKQLGVTLQVVRFKFANAFMSALYQPVFLRYEPDIGKFYSHLKEVDPKFVKTYARASYPYLLDTHNYGYKMTIRMIGYAKAHVTKKKLDSLKPFYIGLRPDIIEEDEGEDE